MYVLPVVLFSAVMNIPKFFETELYYQPVYPNLNETAMYNLTEAEMEELLDWKIQYNMTELRSDPDYIR